MGMGIAFRPLIERTERKSVKDFVEAEGGRIVSDEGPHGKDLERLIASIDLDLSREPELLRFLRQLAGENKDKNQIIENINDMFRRMGIAQKAGNPYAFIYLNKESASIVDGLEAGCYKLVWDDKHEFVVDILRGSYEED